MVNFLELGPSRRTNCTECGTEFTTHRQDDDVCTQCTFYRTNPEMAPKYWTWTRLGNNHWGVMARWPEREDLPNPGDVIVVHRRDGATSTETIDEVRHSGYSRSAAFQVFCSIRQG